MTTLRSVILQTAVRWISPLLLLFSLSLLLRGHNEPGGGFADGLVAATGFALIKFGYSLQTARQLLRIPPLILATIGVGLSLVSGALAWFNGNPSLTGLWVYVPLLPNEAVKIGSPVLFDIGVYLIVVGATLTMLFALAEE